MFLPIQLDVPMRRWPIANWLLIGVTIVTSVAMFGPLSDWEQTAKLAALLDVTVPAEGTLNYFLLQPHHFHPAQLIGHMFLHGNILHLLGNMLFLWLFGNAINARIGQLQFLAFYLGVGILDGLISLAIGPKVPSLGASGAIMGMCGAFFVLYPLNDVTTLFGFFPFWFRKIELSAGWVLAGYMAFDIWGAVTNSQSGVGYLAHIVGFALGASTIVFMLKASWLDLDENERNLLQVWNLMSEPVPEKVIVPPPIVRRRPVTRPRDTGPIPLE